MHIKISYATAREIALLDEVENLLVSRNSSPRQFLQVHQDLLSILQVSTSQFTNNKRVTKNLIVI